MVKAYMLRLCEIYVYWVAVSNFVMISELQPVKVDIRCKGLRRTRSQTLQASRWVIIRKW